MDRPHAPSQVDAVAQLDQYAKPSVEVAKQWLETVILPRRIYDEKRQTYRLVEMGEDPTGSELFPLWKTSLRDLYVFGIGIGLYFRMLLQLGALMFVLAAVSMPSIIYFLSDEYSGPILERTLDDDTKLDMRIWGTAACTRVQPIIEANGDTLKTNNCPLIVGQFHVDLVVLGILCLYTIVSGLTQERMKAYIDEQEQTAADYSIIIKDPNHDAWDPDEWEVFFRQFGKVKFVTVALNNHDLLSALAKKRYMEEMLRMESSDQERADAALFAAIDGPLPPTTYASCLRRVLQKFAMFRDVDYWTRELYYQRKKIERLLRQESYPVWSVVVMFETEEAHRTCMEKTQAGVLAALFDMAKAKIPRQFRFRGTNIMRIEQASEPSSVQWKNIGVRWRRRFLQQLVNVGIVIGMMIGVYYFTMFLKVMYVEGDDVSESKRRKNLYILAYALAVTDLLGCKILHYVDLLEQHQTKEREQLSTLNKMLLFRTFNGAVVIYLLTDFTDMLSEQNLLQIQAILIANLVTTPVLQLISIYDRAMQWIYGPQAKTQKKLNQYYSGTYWQLAERYTQITKIVGTALFFKSLIPTGLVITSLSLFLNYWVDKYCLLRKWKVPPKYDGLLARASRYHLLFMALTSLIMMGHWYDGWPFDQQTQLEVAHRRNNSSFSMVQDVFVYIVGLVFPFQRDYRSEEQTELMRALVISIIAVTCLTVVFLIVKTIYRTWRRYVVGGTSSRSVRTKLSEIPCSDVKHLDGYVPSYESWYSDFPYLCVPLHQIEHRYINWSGDHSAYCLVNDVTDDPALAQHIKGRPLNQLFGSVKQFDMPSGHHVHRHHEDGRGELEAMCGESEGQLYPARLSVQTDLV